MQQFELLEKDQRQNQISNRKKKIFEKGCMISLLVIVCTFCFCVNKFKGESNILNIVLRKEISYQNLINRVIRSDNLGAMNKVYATLKKSEELQKQLDTDIQKINPEYKKIETIAPKRRLLFEFFEDNIIGMLKNSLSDGAQSFKNAITDTEKAMKVFEKGFQFTPHYSQETKTETKESENKDKNEENQADLFGRLFTELIGDANKAFDDLEKFAFGGDKEKAGENKDKDSGKEKEKEKFDPFEKFSNIFDGLFNKIKDLKDEKNVKVFEGKIKDGSKTVGKFIGALFGGFINGAKNGLKEGLSGKQTTQPEKPEKKEASAQDLPKDADGDYDLKEFKLKKMGYNMAPWTLHSARVLKKYFPMNDHLAVLDLNRLMIQDPKKAAQVIKGAYNHENSQDADVLNLKHLLGKLVCLGKGESLEAQVMRGFKSNLDDACMKFLNLAMK